MTSESDGGAERPDDESRRFEALGRQAGGMAHEFNNLLGAILGFASFIAEDSDDAAIRRHAERIAAAGQQAKQLVAEILLASRAAELPVECAPPARTVADGRAVRRGRILLVDDNGDFCDMLSTFLERKGHEVAACGRPGEAMEILRESRECWDLLVTDQTMPEMSGIDFVRQARGLYPDLPCVICTGYADEDFEAEARAAGSRAIVAKPVHLRDFAALIQRLLMP